jgi:hypothetical protein
MKINWLFLICLSFQVFIIAGCAKKGPLIITSVTYTSQSGTILPELQWYEEIHITAEKAVLTRKGMTEDTQVNAGAWEIPLDESSVNMLFEQLGSVDCSRLQRVEAADAPEGGGTDSYTLTYSNGKSCNLYFDPGTTYEGSESIVDHAQDFIQGLAFPSDALLKYNNP